MTNVRPGMEPVLSGPKARSALFVEPAEKTVKKKDKFDVVLHLDRTLHRKAFNGEGPDMGLGSRLQGFRTHGCR